MEYSELNSRNQDNVRTGRSYTAGDKKAEQTARLSKLAVLSLVLGILSLFFFVLAGIPAIVIGIIGTLKIRRSSGTLRGKSIALAGMSVSIVFMVIIYLLWSIDAPPIPNDYTISDLRSAPAQYAESFEVLKTLIDEGTDSTDVPAIELTNSDTDMIAEIRGVIKTATASEISKTLDYYAKEINQIWADNEMARDIIRRLNEYPEIADLTEPGVAFEPLNQRDLIQLARLYEVYVHLQTEEDDIHDVTTQLIELDSVFRKLSPNARLFIGKIVCYVCMTADMVTAGAIANNARASQESIKLLAGHFTPLTKEQLSLRNSVLFEYLLNRNNISDVLGRGIAGKIRLLKKNSTLRFYRNVCDIGINALEDIEDFNDVRFRVWPSVYPDMGPVSFHARKPLPLLYICYNPVGSCILRIRSFHYESMLKRKTAVNIQGDLLQIVLKKRLGKDVSLKACAYSDEYIVDIEKGKIFSPGPDGQANTSDDIMLRINPEVLGWRN